MTDDVLRIERAAQGATVRFSLHGELDLATVSDLTCAVHGPGATPMRSLIIDLRELGFIDAAGLHALLDIDEAARQNGHNVTFVRGRPPVHRAFEITGLADRLVFVDDPDELRPPDDRTDP